MADLKHGHAGRDTMWTSTTRKRARGTYGEPRFKDGFGGLLFYFIKDEYVVLPVLFVVNTDSYKMVTVS